MSAKLKLKTALGIKGTLVVHGKDGVILKTIEMNGSIPLSRLGMTPEQAKQFIKQQEANHGADNRN